MKNTSSFFFQIPNKWISYGISKLFKEVMHNINERLSIDAVAIAAA